MRQIMQVLRGSWLGMFSLVVGISCAMTLPLSDSIPDVTFSDEVIDHMNYIYSVGQLRGNHPDSFTTIGDSITVSQNFLQPIGYGLYELADFGHLQTIIDYYIGTTGTASNAFRHVSVSAGVGWAAWGALDPTLNQSAACSVNESPLACELRVSRPAIALIMFGTNDLHYRTPAQFQGDLQTIVDVTLAQGVIPVLSTIPPQPEKSMDVARFNAVIVDLATTNTLPLWDYHALLLSLPNQGLTWDNIHPSSPPEWFDQAAIFTPENLQYGYVMRNLSALMMLDAIYSAVQAPWWGLCEDVC